mgnify:CR=1 FL=1
MEGRIGEDREALLALAGLPAIPIFDLLPSVDCLLLLPLKISTPLSHRSVSSRYPPAAEQYQCPIKMRSAVGEAKSRGSNPERRPRRRCKIMRIAILPLLPSKYAD